MACEVEDVDVRLVEEREHWLLTRNASCFCSSCHEESYEKCLTTRIYPNLVSKMKRTAVIEQCELIYTGLGPENNVEIFPEKLRRRKGCAVCRQGCDFAVGVRDAMGAERTD